MNEEWGFECIQDILECASLDSFIKKECSCVGGDVEGKNDSSSQFYAL